MDLFIPNHLHLLAKGYIKNPPRSEEITNYFLQGIVESVGMRVVAGPTSVYVSDPGNEGVTGTVTLATSHASIHVWDSQYPAFFQFDLYSCKEFDPNKVLDFINKKFNIEKAQWIFIDRNINFEEIERGEF